MKEVGTPHSQASPLKLSMAACLASILELDIDEVPVPEGTDDDAAVVWRNWLGRRGLGLVPVREPSAFWWTGPWIALLPATTDDGLVAAVAFGAPPGLIWEPIASGGFETVAQGYVMAATDPLLAGADTVQAPRTSGLVRQLLIAPRAEAAMVAVQRAEAEAGRGLRGDRYHEKHGTWSHRKTEGVDLTLIEEETLGQVARDLPGFSAEDARRNIVTRGIALNDLVGWRFRVGEVQCLGRRLCEPCAHLDRIAIKGSLRLLVHRGGLRTDVLKGGEIKIGDEITPVAAVK